MLTMRQSFTCWSFYLKDWLKGFIAPIVCLLAGKTIRGLTFTYGYCKHLDVYYCTIQRGTLEVYSWDTVMAGPWKGIVK